MGGIVVELVNTDRFWRPRPGLPSTVRLVTFCKAGTFEPIGARFAVMRRLGDAVSLWRGTSW